MKSNVGTYIFYAPEMFERSNTNCTVHGEKTDIWALGVTIFYMITGTYPHNKPNNLIDLRDNVVNGKFDWNRIRNEDAKEILKHILEVDPQKRATIDDIKNSKWLTNNGKEEIELRVVGYDRMDKNG